MIRQFFTSLFGEVGSGRLNRMQYLGYLFLLTVLMFLAIFATILLVGAAEQMAGGNLQDVQAMIAEKLGMPAVIGILVLASVFTFASLNITAKRLREMGLPGWPTVLGIVVVGVGIDILFPGEVVTRRGVQQLQPSMVSSTYQAIIFLALALVPGNAFGKRS